MRDADPALHPAHAGDRGRWRRVRSARRCLTLKLELLQHSGSFKARGAFANLLTPRDSGGRRRRGVRRQSRRGGGLCRHEARQAGQDFRSQRFFAGQGRSASATTAPILPIEGDRYADALAASEAWVQQTGAMPVPCVRSERDHHGPGNARPANSTEQAPDIDTVLVAVGGGGLVAGHRRLVRRPHQGHRRRADCLADPDQALEAGRPVDAEAGGLAADSLAPRRVGELVFPIVAEIRAAHRAGVRRGDRRGAGTLWRALRIVAEPGGAAAFSAILSGAYRPAAGERVAVVISGGNTTAVNFDLTR